MLKIKKTVYLILTIISLFVSDLSAQNYEFTLSHRRRFDQIEVEIWAKRLKANAPKIGYASLVLEFNSNYLKPSLLQQLGTTDSINRNLNKPIIIDAITSLFDARNGYAKLVSTQITSKYYSLELSLGNLGNSFAIVDSAFRGTFIGKMTFDIINNPLPSSNTDVKWSTSLIPGDIRVFDADSNDIESTITFTNPNNFTIVGVTLLNPGYKGQILDRDNAPLGIKGTFAGKGYPVYIERSVNPTKYKSPGLGGVVDDNVAFLYEYSLDNGKTWKEIGRVAERNTSETADGYNPKYRSGDILNPINRYYLTSQDSSILGIANYRKPTRVFWANNPIFQERSETARIRVTQLDGTSASELTARSKSNVADSSHEAFLIGRLFFAQLNGVNQYFKTEKLFSNSTQLTVEAWVNLNGLSLGGNPAIVASSAGPKVNGEGAWMLYLENGTLPAFRAREILGRGDSGYVGRVKAVYPLSIVSDTLPLIAAHSTNWTHIAATVENNIVRLYVDGELIDESINSQSADIRMQTTNHPIWIGVNPDTAFSPANHLHAGIQGVKVWRTALSQDQIRSLVNGVIDPPNISQGNDIKKSLVNYFDFEGGISDLASNPLQDSANNLIYYTSDSIPSNDNINFRTGEPHIRITSPNKFVGLTNMSTDVCNVRWVAYGMNDYATPNTKDVELQYTIDGLNWYALKTDKGDTTAVDVEKTSSFWVPFNNNLTSANLRVAPPKSNNVTIKIRGVAQNGLQDVYSTAGPITISRFLALKRNANDSIAISGKLGMNINLNNAFIEAWIRPYFLPTTYFPIISKVGADSSQVHYALNLLSTGQLQFIIADTNGVLKTAVSDTITKLLAPKKVSLDTAWTHIAVFLDKNVTGQSKILFYVDGTVQNDTSITNQLGLNLRLNSSNTFATYIGSSPNKTGDGFVGEIREVRLWNSVPNNLAYNGVEPTELTKFVQGELAVRTKDLKPSSQTNLFAAFSFDGTQINRNTISNVVTSTNNPNIYARFGSNEISYIATRPFIKLVEPTFRQKVSNTKTDLRVRWVGFDYDGMAFSIGDPNKSPSLEYSSRGGGGASQLYKFVGSLYNLGNTVNSSMLIDSSNYRFKGGNTDVVFATKLNTTIANQDVNGDGITNDQGALSPALTNARLRLNSVYTFEGLQIPIQSESPLFTITPIDNFTLRVLLEGHHDGLKNSSFLRDLGTTFNQGAIQVTLYSDNSGIRGVKVITDSSIRRYEDLDPINRNAGNKKFGNVNFLFTDLTDGKYWVKVEHQNHLPIMSRFPIQFKYEGDNKSTWAIESGWDFETWDGVDDNVMKFDTDDAVALKAFNAKGDAISTITNPGYNTTGLIYNNGQAGAKTIGLAAMVGGDVNQDGQINAADRIQVRLDDGTKNLRSDVTGDGFINADDRTIVDRNFGKVSSLYAEPKGIVKSSSSDLVKITHKKENQIQAGSINYRVNAVTKKNGDVATVDFYIKNVSGSFKLANCTFAISYDTSCVKYESLAQIDTIIFADKPELGYYSKLRSAPTNNANNVLSGVRTIEIDYDKNFVNGGIEVPFKDTYLGTLRFKIISKDKVVKFNWHNSTSLHSVDNEIVTPLGKFDTIAPLMQYAAKVSFPNGGESFLPNRLINVTWTTDGTQKVRLDYSTDGGTSWNTSNTVTVSAKSANLQLPNASSSNCLVRIVDFASGVELDRSDSMWTIQSGFAQITSPNSAEGIYKGGGKSTIQFVAKGYPKVKFEFTEDGIKWYQLLNLVDGNLRSVDWNIPLINTSNARIRMTDFDTNEELAISSVFKIVIGTVKFKNPIANESVRAGSNYRVRWSSTNLKRFDLQVSTDGGFNWNDEAKSVDAILGYFNWIVPPTFSNNVLFRAILENDETVEFDRTKAFTIWNGTYIEENIDGFEINQISPNPANIYASLNINSKIESEVTFDIIDNKGNKINEFTKLISIGNNVINLSLNDLSSGNYFIIIKQNDKSIIRELKVVK